MSLPTIDFETYSEAGMVWNAATGRWQGVTKTSPGLPAVGAAVYGEHPRTQVLCLAYDLLGGTGPQLWLPGMEPPLALFRHVTAGGLIEAHNASFEYWIWLNVCHKRMGWPMLPYSQLRCSMAKSRAYSLPGKLGEIAKVLGASEQKDPRGEQLIRKLSVPQQATKQRAAGQCTDPQLLAELWAYCLQDVKAEQAVSALIPDLDPDEQELWLLDQNINLHGVAIDRVALGNCIEIVRQATDRYTEELRQITDGTVQSVGELAKITGWLGAQGVHTSSLDADRVEELLKEEHCWPPAARRVLEIRASLGAASVKKLFAIERRLSADGRLHDLFAFCGADRTGRFCIAEGQLVLVRTPEGEVLEVPIESVGLRHELWDGREWVTHGGVVAAGVKEVITHDEVTATLDHKVFTSTTEYATLAQVKKSGQTIFRGEKSCPTLSTNLSPPAESVEKQPRVP
jgi:hypothetical protein